MATLTAETKSIASNSDAYKLLIGSGYFLAIGGGNSLQIQPAQAGMGAETRNTATLTSATKNAATLTAETRN